MTEKIKIIGVHPIKSIELCHLLEISIINPGQDFDWMKITQHIEGHPQSNWQVPYDEQLIEQKDHEYFYAFFFHYLDFSKTLKTPFGEIKIPSPTKMPNHLKKIKYFSP